MGGESFHYREYHCFDPSSPVECMWEMRGDSGVQRVVTDARVEIVFHLAHGFEQQRGGRWAPQPQAIVAGQITRPLLIRPTAPVDTFGIRLKSWAAGAVIGCDAASFTDCISDGAAIHRKWALLLERLGNAPARQRLDLARDAMRLSARGERLVGAVQLAEALSGQCTVDALARASSLSARQLDRLFYRNVGVGPKLFLRMLRFRSVFVRVRDQSNTNWAAVAAAAGYNDQSHLNRDFRQFAGCSPTASTDDASDLARHFTGV